jgi:UDP-N-acetylglucosamine 2-epimerase (non-hydrolysing)
MLAVHIVGARPNFMKAAPVLRALKHYPAFTQMLVHTGQHYDDNMSQVFFRDLDLPVPDVNLEVGSGSHAAQTAETMLRIERVLVKEKPKLVLVYGDVNSTVAATLVAVKLGVLVAHVEAGLRSFDRSMPEEINRIVTDSVADVLFTPSEDGDENLLREGVAPDRIFRVGNVMIDTVLRLAHKADERWPLVSAALELPEGILRDQGYVLVTLHRPSNVDEPARLGALLETLADISRALPVVFPVHPRTRERLRASGATAGEQLHLVPPAGYLDFLALQKHAALVITDSGGIQEETTFLGVPCLTMRANTERPITTSLGTNRLIGSDFNGLIYHVKRILSGERPIGRRPPLWDGHAAERIAAVLGDLCASDRRVAASASRDVTAHAPMNAARD